MTPIKVLELIKKHNTKADPIRAIILPANEMIHYFEYFAANNIAIDSSKWVIFWPDKSRTDRYYGIKLDRYIVCFGKYEADIMLYTEKKGFHVIV